MKNTKKTIERLSEISQSLKHIAEIENNDALEAAITKNDKEALLEVCKKSKVPRAYRTVIVNLLLSVDPKKYPIFL
ncbi:MAG: hypothetical protein NWF01_07780 [Candidatus Bathyarchaeota archaeon]|nr:hypothetical protein [Candidatus Bathyarchaeota archaeon]